MAAIAALGLGLMLPGQAMLEPSEVAQAILLSLAQSRLDAWDQAVPARVESPSSGLTVREFHPV